MNLSNIPMGTIFTFDSDDNENPEVFMRGVMAEPGLLYNAHRIYPAPGLFQYPGIEQVTQVTVERIQVKAVQD